MIIIGSNNGSSFGRRHAIIWTSAGILVNGSLGMKFSEILIEIYIFIQENAYEAVVCTCRLQNDVYFVSASTS